MARLAKVNRCLPATLILAGMVCVSSLQSHAATESDPALTEFRRALSIIEKTQLTLFRETPAASADTIAKTFFEHSTEDDPQKQIENMRETLARTMAGYNDAYANYILSLIHI